MSRWGEYVRSTVKPGERQIDIAARCHIDQTTISRWLHDEQRSITPQTVAAFAHGYGRPVLEAFVHAGLITADDARVRVVRAKSLDDISTDALLAELQKRTKASAS